MEIINSKPSSLASGGRASSSNGGIGNNQRRCINNTCDSTINDRLGKQINSSSLIIHLPTTSANNLNDPNQLDQQNSEPKTFNDNDNNHSSELPLLLNANDLEQNNLFNHCLHLNSPHHHHHRHPRQSVDTDANRNNNVLTTGSSTSSRSQHYHPHTQLNFHSNHLNNFHNHITNRRSQQQQHLLSSTNTSNSQQDNNSENQSTDVEATTATTPPPSYHDIPGVVPAYQGRSSGPPPAYDDVINPNALPPTYQSLFGQVREARKTSNGMMDLFRQLFLVLIGTIGCTMIIGFLLLIPITMILVGIVYVNDCRAENIPWFLVIGGFVWIMKNVLNCYNQFKKDAASSNRPPPRRRSALNHHQQQQHQSHLLHPSRSPIMTNTTNANNSDLSSSSPSSSPRISRDQSLSLSTGSTASSVLIINSSQESNSNTTSTITSTSCSSSSSSSANSDSNSETAAATTTSSSSSSTSIPTTTTSNRRNSINLGNSSGTTTTTTAATTTTTTTTTTHHHIRHPPMVGLTSYKCESILNYFLIVWFLAGCIVVYRIYEPDYDNPTSANYCNRLVYMYAFWLMTSAFIVMAIILSCLCCLMASSLMSCTHGR